MQPSTTIETVTPALATKWLESNTHNCVLSQHLVDNYAVLINNGEWELNGESIKFDVNGTLLDGQHRLWAIIEANKSIKTMVIRNLEPQVMDTLDTGRCRSAANVLQIKGFVNGSVLASAAKMLCSFDRGEWGEYQERLFKSISNHTVLETVKAHPSLGESVSYIRGRSQKLRPFVPESLGAALHYIFNRISPEVTEEFFTSFIEGTNLDVGHPVLVLRNTLFKIKGHSRNGLCTRAALVIKAWNFHIRNKTARTLVWRNFEEFPKIELPTKARKKA